MVLFLKHVYSGLFKFRGWVVASHFFHFHQVAEGKISKFDVYIKGKVGMYTMSWDFLYTSFGEDCWGQP